MAVDLVIDVDDPFAEDVRSLIAMHLAFARLHTPPEDIHALPSDAYDAGDVTLFSARSGGKLVAIGALRHLGEGHGEIKSMHTTVSARGFGVGRAMVDHLVAVARERGYRRVSLETGTMDAFRPAVRLYERCGFVVCEPFGVYRSHPGSVCMTREL